MSMIKAYIDKMMDQGIDVLALDNPEYDAEYQKYLEESYRESLDEMNDYFMDHPDEVE
jgi:hypothetical protein